MGAAWRPPPGGDQTESIELTSDEALVLAHALRHRDVTQLAAATGLSERHVRHVLARLEILGVTPGAPAPGAAPPSAGAAPSPPPSRAPEPSAPETAELDAGPEPEESAEPDEPLEDLGPAEPEDERAPGATPSVADEQNWRKIFEIQLRPLDVKSRVAAARTATGATLSALCFDPEPEVVHALLSNTAAGLAHARLVAAHHHQSAGLEHLFARNELARDPQVQRRILRNSGASEQIVRRILGTRRLVELFKAAIDREVPERTRVVARSIFRMKWPKAEPDERVDLVISTEGRALMQLPGATFDGRMTAMLCQKTLSSALLIRNLARFGATPGMLLAALLRQPMVRRSPELKLMILRHPNTPADAKRGAR